MTEITDPVIQAFLEQKLEIIRSRFEPTALILFGSRIAGAADLYSDIDLIVVSERFRGMRFLDRMVEFLATVDWRLGLDALCYTPEEFERKRQEGGLVSDACRKGIWVEEPSQMTIEQA